PGDDRRKSDQRAGLGVGGQDELPSRVNADLAGAMHPRSDQYRLIPWPRDDEETTSLRISQVQSPKLVPGQATPKPFGDFGSAAVGQFEAQQRTGCGVADEKVR